MTLSKGAALGALILFFATPSRGQLVIEEMAENARGDGWSLAVAGKADYPDGVVLVGCLKAAHDAQRVLDQRSCPVSSGRYEFEFGPYPAPLFPYEHSVSVLFSPGQQPEGSLSTLPVSPGAVETARSYRPGEIGEPGIAKIAKALSEETSRIEVLLGEVEALAVEAERILAGPARGGEEASRAMAGWRAGYEELRETRARAARRWAFPAYLRSEGEIHVLVNHLIDLAYALKVREEGEKAEVGPPARRPIGPALAAARRAFAYEAVLLDPDPDRAVLERWALPLATFFERLAARPPGDGDAGGPPPDAPERLRLFDSLATLVRHRESLHLRPARAKDEDQNPWTLWSNVWFLGLAEITERLDTDFREPPFDRLPAARVLLARAGLALVREWRGEIAAKPGEDFAAVAAEYIQKLELASHPRDAFDAHLATARALADEILAGPLEAKPTPDMAGDSGEWDARALRLLEAARGRVPESLAGLVESPPDLEARGMRLSRFVAALAAHRERIELARSGEPYPEAENEAASLRREIQELGG